MQNFLTKFKTYKKSQLLALLLVLAFGFLIVYLYQPKKTDNPKKISPAKLTEKVPQPLKTFKDFGIKIDSLKISAPIIPQVDGYDEKVYYAALKKGVAQFKGSVNPDQDGNIFIYGHSSYFKGVVGDYKEVFKELNKLKEGDEFLIYYNQTPYRYKVSKSFETHDKDWTLIDPTPETKDDKTATIMTCYPPGTTDKRWAVIAQQI